MKSLIIFLVFCIGTAYSDSDYSVQHKMYKCDLTVKNEPSGLWAKVNFKNKYKLAVGLYLNSYLGKGEVEDTVFDILKSGRRIGYQGSGLYSNRLPMNHLIFVQPDKIFSFKANVQKNYLMNRGVYKIQYVTFLYLPGESGMIYEVRSNPVTMDLK